MITLSIIEHRGTEVLRRAKCGAAIRVLLARIPQITRILFFTKTSKTLDNVISLSDFCSASSDMVFICKHLRPYPLNPCTFLRQLMPLSGKNKKNSVVMFGGTEEEPTPSPSQRDGSWNVSIDNMFLVFLLFESFPIRRERC